MQDVLLLAEHDVTTAESGEQALKLLDEPPFDLLVTDVLMSGISGIVLAERVRNHPEWKDVPIVFVSASSTPSDEHVISTIERAFFLRKPFNADELQAIAKTALEAG